MVDFLLDLLPYLTPFFIFAFGISGGGSKSKSRPMRVPIWDPEQFEVFRKLGETISGGVEAPTPTYPGTIAVPETPEESSWINAVTASFPQTWANITKLTSGEVPYDIGPEWAEKYFEEAIRPEYMREWEEFTLPALRAAWAGPGYWGGERAEAETKEATKLGETLAGEKAELMYGEELARRQAIETALQTGLQAAGVLPQLAAPAITAGETARAIAQEEEYAQLQRWLSGEEIEGDWVPAYSPYVQLAFQYLGLSPYELGQKSTSQSGGGGISMGSTTAYS